MGYRYTDRLSELMPPVGQKRTQARAAPVRKAPAAPVKKANSPSRNQSPLTPRTSPAVRSSTSQGRSPTPTSVSGVSASTARVPSTVPNAVVVDGAFQSRLLPCPAKLAPVRKVNTLSRVANAKPTSTNSSSTFKDKANNNGSAPTDPVTEPTVTATTIPTATTSASSPRDKASTNTTAIVDSTENTRSSPKSRNRHSSKANKRGEESNSSVKRGSRTKREIRSKTSRTTSTTQKRGPDDDSNDDDSDSSSHSPPPNKRSRNTKRHSSKRLPIIDETYELKFVIKGHTEDNIPVRSVDDLEDSKDNWSCAFEPNMQQKGVVEGTAMDVVAVCGSYTVLFLDTQQGRYIKKYTHPESQEIFYCLAWTTLTGKEQFLIEEGGHQNSGSKVKSDDTVEESEGEEEDKGICNILAVAGRLGSIKLLNPLQNECYRYLFGHRKAVLALTFAKAEPRWLLSASADRTVRLWDIGSPRNTEDDSSCLAMFVLPENRGGIPTSVDISYNLSTVIVGCDDGDMYRFEITAKHLETFRTRAQEHRTKQPQNGNKWSNLGALATIKPKLRYPAGDEWHAGYVDDVHILGQDGDGKHKMNNLVVSRAAEDMEIIVWNPAKSTAKDGDIHMSLEWPPAEGSSGLNFKLIEKDGHKVIVSGDYDGGIRVYNIGDGKRSKMLQDKSLEQRKPIKSLFHSLSSELMRDVACSSDTRTIVAIDNNNTIFVWGSKSSIKQQ